MRPWLRLSLALGLLAPAGCGAGEHVFASLPGLQAETTGLLVTEARGGNLAFESFEPGGPSPKIEVESGSGTRVYCGVLDGPLDRLGLPSGPWTEWSGARRGLAEIDLLEALVLDADGPAPALKAEPSAAAFFARLEVPDLRSCLQLALSPSAVQDQSPRLFDVLDVGSGRFITLDGDGTLELHTAAGRSVVDFAGGVRLYLRSLAFDPNTRELYIVSRFGGGLHHALVPPGSFVELEPTAVTLGETESPETIDVVVLEPNGPSFVAIATTDPLGTARVRLRSVGLDERVFELPTDFPADLEVRVAGPDQVLLFDEEQLWFLGPSGGPQRVALPDTTGLLALRWVPAFGMLLGLSDGSVRRFTDGKLETVVELGGWWVLDLAPFQRGFAYLLANGVIGQFIEGEGRCAETPVLGTLNRGNLVPSEERWFVSGVLPEGLARMAILPRAELP